MKNYELSNHLGNVLAVITDEKLWSDSLGGYIASVVSASDYEPFGLVLEGRSLQDGGYRWGFNGMEKNEETDFYSTEFRDLNVKIARWNSIDPKQEHQIWLSPYCSMNNNPIALNDPKGDIAPAIWAAIVYALETGAETGVDVALGITIEYLTGTPYTGWDVAADYFTNLFPGWGEIRKTKKFAQIATVVAELAVKFHKIPGATKLLNQVTTGLNKFKETGNLEYLSDLRGKIYEVRLLNIMSNVVGAGSNARQVAEFSGLTKNAGELLNKGFGDVTWDVVQKTEKGILNLVEAKAGELKGATALFGRGGLPNSDDAKDIVKKLEFFAEFQKQGGKGTLEFNFADEVTDELKENILQFAERRGIDRSVVKIITGN